MLDSESVGVLRPSRTTDRYENSTLVYSGVTHRVDGCQFDPGGSTEDNDGRRAISTTPVLYLPAGADVEPHDKIERRGVVYEIDGDVADWGDDGSVVKLKRDVG